MGTSRPLRENSIPLPAATMRVASLPGPVRGVLFDLCNVLYDATVWRRWLLRVLGKLGLHTTYGCFFRVWQRDYLDDVHRGQSGFCEAFAEFLRSVGLSRGQIEEIQVACRSRRIRLEDEARLLPGVNATLAKLHGRGLVLGAIGNSERTADQLRQRLGRFGVETLFATVVSSIDLRQTMPDPFCYRTALEAMGLPAAEVAFVGHDPAELAGAAAAGMSTVAFNQDPDARADAALSRFDDLPELVGSARPAAAAG